MATATRAIRTPPFVPSIPALPGLPLIGNLVQFWRDRLSLQDGAAALGPIVRFSLGKVAIYVVTDADLAHEILTEHAPHSIKSVGLNFLEPLLGHGLLTEEGEPHKRNRKLLAPAFAPKRLSAYGEVMVEESAAQVARWQPGQQVDLASEMMQLTLAIAGRTLFGADVRGDVSVVATGLELAMHSLLDNVSSPVRLGYNWPLPRHLRMKRAVKLLDGVVYRLIAEGRAAGTDRGDVLSMLLLARDEADGVGFTDAQVRDEVMTLLLAGHETTANTLTWSWYELGRNPGALARLIAEIDEVLGDRPVTAADLPNLPWNLAVIEEAMRLHPPAYNIGRELTEDITLAGHHLPAGATLLVNIRGIQRHPAYYPAPLAFRPERMFADAKKARPRHHYLPFGAGPRVCIGSHFALLEGQLALATLVQRAKIRTLTQYIVPEPLVTLRPRGGLPAIVTPR